MSPAEVKASEASAAWEESGDTLAFRTTIAGLAAYAAYNFVNSKFFFGRYVIVEPHSNRNAHISDYEKLRDLVTRKYGEPDLDDMHWDNDLFKDSPDSWGTAVASGHMSMLATWETERALISTMLTGDNFEISLSIAYESKALAEEADAAAEQRTLNDL